MTYHLSPRFYPSVFCAVVLSLSLSSCKLTSTSQNQTATPSVFSGQVHLLSDYPRAISLIGIHHQNQKSWCSGVRVAPHFILTTASCLYPSHTPSQLRDLPFEQHHISVIQYVDHITSHPRKDSQAVVHSIKASGIFGVDIYPAVMRDPGVHALQLHDLALISTTLSPTQDEDSYIPLLSTFLPTATREIFHVYGFSRSIHKSDLAQSTKNAFRSTKATLSTTYFSQLAKHAQTLKPSPSLNNIEKKQQMDYRKQLVTELNHMSQIFNEADSGAVVIRTIHENLLKPVPGICKEDQGGAIVYTDSDGNSSLYAIMGTLQPIKEKTSLSPFIANNNLITSLFNLLICPPYSQAFVIARYADWITTTIKKRAQWITNDSQSL